ncbi:hypothetical protein [Saccharopolyspora shandongensis]|uniref:hypothetical protein n=1 Tax=Saccharopolyspora shandongensis TaxID=418495 RepID=UPI0033CDA3FA
MGEDGRERRPFRVPVVRRRWPQLGIAAACAVVLVIAAYFVVTTTNGCASGLHRAGPLDECVGVTDGPGEFGLSDGQSGFDGSLRVVQDKIAAENARVRRISREQNKPYVSIAYFSPLTVAKPDTTTIEAVRRGLEGTYVSQLRANADGREEWGGNLPLIQVLLANPGSRSAQWEPVVEQLRQLAEPEENGRLVAVTGLGQSLAGTRDAINRLSQHGIPMVGAIITADKFATDPAAAEAKGLLRVAPPNSAQAGALVKRLEETQLALVVWDRNEDEVFARDLANAYEAAYQQRGGKLARGEPFDSAQLATANTFPAMVPNICLKRPDVILFAGRLRELKPFLNALSSRSCTELKMRVLITDSVVDVGGDPEIQRSLESGITLEYSQLAAPEAWRAAPQYFPRRSTEYFIPGSTATAVFQQEFPGESIDDGLAIVTFDALGVAITAARRAVHNNKFGEKLPSADGVAAEFDRMSDTGAVDGASGWLSFDTETGRPDSKALLVFRVTKEIGRPVSSVPVVISETGTPYLP